MAVGVGCELKYAGRRVYARGLDLAHPAATEVGPTRRLCERVNGPPRPWRGLWS